MTKTLGTAKIEIPFRKWLSEEHLSSDMTGNTGADRSQQGKQPGVAPDGARERLRCSKYLTGRNKEVR